MSTEAELRAENDYLRNKNTALTGCLEELAKHGLRADLMPTRTGREETVVENESWWYEYINGIDRRLKGHAQAVLDMVTAADDEREVDAIASASGMDDTEHEADEHDEVVSGE